MVGFETSDDAGVYRLNDDTALVMTADFITPPVDDPYIYGQIAAANSLSDIYAMGATPRICLNLAAFPSNKLEPEVLHQIIAGALSKITEAGAILVGGHTTDDDEPKFGLAVTGTVHPQQYWSNSGAQVGDVLLLTRPIGSGVLFNANLKGWVSAAALDACIAELTRLNKTAMETLRAFTVHAATDVTGFGLAGHAFEMIKNSDCRFEIDIDSVPIFAEALAMYQRGMRTGVNRHNRALVAEVLHFERQLPEWHEEIFFDPQTNGGLLVAVPEQQGQAALQALHAAGVTSARCIGRVHAAADICRLVLA